MMRYEDIKDHFYYDETSPSCLKWKTVLYSGNSRPMTTIGGDAGNFGDRYYVVQVHGKKYFCHKIVYLLHGCKLNSKEKVDHHDRNQKNNRISNLRVATQKMNCENRRKSSANTSGVTGVSFSIKSGVTYCVAHWKESRKTVTKSFSVKKFGILSAFKFAVQYRSLQIEKLNELGANYTENHGKV